MRVHNFFHVRGETITFCLHAVAHHVLNHLIDINFSLRWLGFVSRHLRRCKTLNLHVWNRLRCASSWKPGPESWPSHNYLIHWSAKRSWKDNRNWITTFRSPLLLRLLALLKRKESKSRRGVICERNNHSVVLFMAMGPRKFHASDGYLWGSPSIFVYRFVFVRWVWAQCDRLGWDFREDGRLVANFRAFSGSINVRCPKIKCFRVSPSELDIGFLLISNCLCCIALLQGKLCKLTNSPSKEGCIDKASWWLWLEIGFCCFMVEENWVLLCKQHHFQLFQKNSFFDRLLWPPEARMSLKFFEPSSRPRKAFSSVLDS